MPCDSLNRERSLCEGSVLWNCWDTERHVVFCVFTTFITDSCWVILKPRPTLDPTPWTDYPLPSLAFKEWSPGLSILGLNLKKNFYLIHWCFTYMFVWGWWFPWNWDYSWDGCKLPHGNGTDVLWKSPVFLTAERQGCVSRSPNSTCFSGVSELPIDFLFSTPEKHLRSRS